MLLQQCKTISVSDFRCSYSAIDFIWKVRQWQYQRDGRQVEWRVTYRTLIQETKVCESLCIGPRRWKKGFTTTPNVMVYEHSTRFAIKAQSTLFEICSLSISFQHKPTSVWVWDDLETFVFLGAVSFGVVKQDAIVYTLNLTVLSGYLRVFWFYPKTSAFFPPSFSGIDQLLPGCK